MSGGVSKFRIWTFVPSATEGMCGDGRGLKHAPLLHFTWLRYADAHLWRHDTGSTCPFRYRPHSTCPKEQFGSLYKIPQQLDKSFDLHSPPLFLVFIRVSHILLDYHRIAIAFPVPWLPLARVSNGLLLLALSRVCPVKELSSPQRLSKSLVKYLTCSSSGRDTQASPLPETSLLRVRRLFSHFCLS